VCRNVPKSLWEQQKFGWAVPLNALRRNGPECAAAFDYIRSIKIGVTKDPGLEQGCQIFSEVHGQT